MLNIGVWTRLYHTNASVLDDIDLNLLELQLGADNVMEIKNCKE